MQPAEPAAHPQGQAGVSFPGRNRIAAVSTPVAEEERSGGQQRTGPPEPRPVSMARLVVGGVVLRTLLDSCAPGSLLRGALFDDIDDAFIIDVRAAHPDWHPLGCGEKSHEPTRHWNSALLWPIAR